MASGRVSKMLRQAAWRSATQGPSYSSAATSYKGAKSISTSVCPWARACASAAAQALS